MNKKETVLNKPAKPINEPSKPITRDKQRGFAVVERLFTLATLATTILIAVGDPKLPKTSGD